MTPRAIDLTGNFPIDPLDAPAAPCKPAAPYVDNGFFSTGVFSSESEGIEYGPYAGGIDGRTYTTTGNLAPSMKFSTAMTELGSTITREQLEKLFSSIHVPITFK